MRIEEEYIKTGYFWLPGKIYEKVPGVLTIEDGGNITLEIVGLFDNEKGAFNEDFNLGRIIGSVEGDGLVTLEDCFYTKKSMSVGGISKSKVCVNKVLCSVAYEKDEEITFNTLSFSVDCIDEWVGVSGIKVDTDWKNRTATISYEPPASIEIELDDGMKLEIGFIYTLPGFPASTEAKISQQAFFKIKSVSLRPLNEFIEYVYKITNLMCFAIDATVSIKNVSATSSEIKSDVVNGSMSPVSVGIYYSSTSYTKSVPTNGWHQMLFTYGTIKSNASEVFSNWIKAYEEIAPALNLYFSTKSGAQKYLDGKFLALAQGLETYHRRTSTEKLMDSSSFENLISGIIENCPENYKEWLNGRLMHGNEINLGKRLKGIIEPFKGSLGNSGARSKLLRKVVDTRNYLTHYNDELKDKAASGKELWSLCQKMEAIFQLHFLKVIGFNDSEIDGVIENCYPLKQKLELKTPIVAARSRALE
jgi:hypothetical protein